MKHVEGWLRACEAGACVEVKRNEYGMVLLRSSDSRWKEAMLTEPEWQQFIQDCKDGKFDELEEDHYDL